MAWLPKISNISLFVLAQLTNVMDRQTDGQTDTGWRHIPRLCIASRGKNWPKPVLNFQTLLKFPPLYNNAGMQVSNMKFNFRPEVEIWRILRMWCEKSAKNDTKSKTCYNFHLSTRNRGRWFQIRSSLFDRKLNYGGFCACAVKKDRKPH